MDKAQQRHKLRIILDSEEVRAVSAEEGTIFDELLADIRANHQTVRERFGAIIRVGGEMYHSIDPKVLRSVLKHVGNLCIITQWHSLWGGGKGGKRSSKKREHKYL